MLGLRQLAALGGSCLARVPSLMDFAFCRRLPHKFCCDACLLENDPGSSSSLSLPSRKTGSPGHSNRGSLPVRQPSSTQQHFRDSEMSRQSRGGVRPKTKATGVYAPEAAALIDAMGSRGDRSYQLIVEQACVEHPVELATTPVAGLQRNPIDGLLTNDAMSGACVNPHSKRSFLVAYVMGEVYQVGIGAPLAQRGTAPVLDALAIAAVNLHDGTATRHYDIRSGYLHNPAVETRFSCNVGLRSNADPGRGVAVYHAGRRSARVL